jgi:hypothetical protein
VALFDQPLEQDSDHWPGHDTWLASSSASMASNSATRRGAAMGARQNRAISLSFSPTQPATERDSIDLDALTQASEVPVSIRRRRQILIRRGPEWVSHPIALLCRGRDSRSRQEPSCARHGRGDGRVRAKAQPSLLARLFVAVVQTLPLGLTRIEMSSRQSCAHLLPATGGTRHRSSRAHSRGEFNPSSEK